MGRNDPFYGCLWSHSDIVEVLESGGITACTIYAGINNDPLVVAQMDNSTLTKPRTE
jgi:hypothetical protein